MNQTPCSGPLSDTGELLVGFPTTKAAQTTGECRADAVPQSLSEDRSQAGACDGSRCSSPSPAPSHERILPEPSAPRRADGEHRTSRREIGRNGRPRCLKLHTATLCDRYT